MKQNSFSICLLILCSSVTVAMASSTILNGMIEGITTNSEGQVTADSKVKLRATHSPYCSETPLSRLLTHRSGHYEPFTRKISDYKTLFIDEVPVTPEQMAAILKPGMRGTMFMNRKFPYFLRIEARNPGSQIGHVAEVSKSGDHAVISSPQHNHGPGRERVIGKEDSHWKGTYHDPEEGITTFSDTHYPPNLHEVAIKEATEVIAVDGSVQGTGADAVLAIVGKAVLYQPERSVQRIELLPEGYGDWSLLQTEAFLGNHPQMKFSQMGVMRSTQVVPHTIPARNSDGSPQLTKSGDPKQIKGGISYHMYRLLGMDGHGERFGESYVGDYQVPIYHKGAWNILDGYYSIRFNFDHLMYKPGNFVVSTARRTRVTPDSIMYSTEQPSAWGTITAMEGKTITVEAPEIEGVPVSGIQRFEVAEDTEFVHLSKPIPRTDALKVGALVKVFKPHPARFFLAK